MKRTFLVFILIFLCRELFAQSSFIDYQKNNTKAGAAFISKEDTLKKQFAAAGLSFPPKQMYIRSFKYDSELEIWVKQNIADPFRLFKTYKVCAMSGALGPKRMEGDFQVPEGFYHINEFNPNSNYHFSLGLNYPNCSDKAFCDSLQPGGEIYIHGGCVTVGCIPVQDNQIEELYILASYATNAGQDFIPVHIFPIRYNVKKSVEYLEKTTKGEEPYQIFSGTLKKVFEYFNENKKLPIIGVNGRGRYVVIE